jgi:alpha-beta hydrolase superfamily lysophospholipase
MEFGNAAMSTGPEWIGQAPHEGLRRRSRPMLPDTDPFYLPPPGFEHARPGTVLRSREVELAFLGLVPQQLIATQLLYRTADLNGHPQATVTTVIAPTERTAERPCPILSYQCAIDAIAGRCFPSYAEGWAVSVPDHEGLEGVWGAPYEPGYHVLDGLRAALNHDPLNLSHEAPVGLWGYSGGGLATAWAAEVQADYAPDLNVVGAVLGSPVGDLGHTFRRLNGTFFSGLPALVVAALSHVYPGLERIISEHATQDGKAMLKSLEQMTTGEAMLRMIRKDMDSLVDRPLAELLETPEVRHVFDSIKLGTKAPSIPVLIVQAVHDELISVEVIDELAAAYAAGGTDVTYHRDGLSEHLLLHPLSAPMTLRWLRDRFAERPLTAHVGRTTWPTLLNPSTYRGMLRLGLISAKVMTGRRVERRPLSDLDQ